VRGADPDAPDAVGTVRGQHALAKTPGEVLAVRLLPQDPPAVPEAVAAIEEADWVILGPGSWFTSVLPHLLVPALARALTETKARRLLVLNLAPQAGETDGFTPADHVDVLLAHAPDLRLDAILVDPATLGAPVCRVPGGRPDSGQLAALADRLGARIHCVPVAADGDLPYHDPTRLADAIRHILQ
jgi:uncharacterized cofD-like protein